MKRSKFEHVKIVAYMFVLTTVCTAVIAGINVTVTDGIAANRKMKDLTGVLKVLGITPPPAAAPEELDQFAKTRVTKIKTSSGYYYAGFSDNGEVTGYAFPFSGPGFWGPINGYCAVDKSVNKITAVTFISHTETPGLGARITEPWFTRQFEGLHITSNIENTPVIRILQPGSGHQERAVDGITGASGTSKAVEKLLNAAVEKIRNTPIGEQDSGADR